MIHFAGCGRMLLDLLTFEIAAGYIDRALQMSYLVEGTESVGIGLGTSEEWIHSEEFEETPDSAVARRWQIPQPEWRETGTGVAGD